MQKFLIMSIYVCLYICMSVYICMYIYMSVYMYVCIYVCLYICMSIYVCMYVRPRITTKWNLMKLCRHDPWMPGKVFHPKNFKIGACVRAHNFQLSRSVL